jgi:hydrogenase maturation protein HypF
VSTSSFEIYIKGLVQGVGFRPFVFRLAEENGLKGWVENRTDGVLVKINGEYQEAERFAGMIRAQAPTASIIKDVQIVSSQNPEEFSDFRILESKDRSEEITEISPDIAVCYDCLEDMKMQPRRINYPFTNCTNCGPRFTIIKDLPYDRAKTTMDDFEMCKDCKEEYHDIHNRRFHAQPVSCNFCGPQYEFYQQGRVLRDTFKIVQEIKKQLYRGKIIAVKGVGGFHLMCDATNQNSVKKLRELKDRDQKPFAVMFPDFEKLKEYAYVNPLEKELLLSWRRPVVLLKQKKILSESINSGLDSLGVMLPYMPLHFILFEEIDLKAIVLTSANPSDEPIVKDNKQALKRLSTITDSFLLYDREIENRTDDSVIQVFDENIQLLRRSRGYVPSPVDLNFDASGILATGAELKNTFAVGKSNQAILSQHIGDLKNFETFDFYTDAVNKFLKLFRVNPGVIVSDMHPDYMSTKYARNFIARYGSGNSRTGNPRPEWIKVQHHHAHIASVMAEHGLDEKVIGVALDGTGYGDDEKIWGGEFFICDLQNYNRYTHFEYIPLPGGDKAVQSPWRTALAYLYQAFGKKTDQFDLDFLKNKKTEDIKLILSMIRKQINSPMTSSTGRLFDAVSAILNLCTDNCYEAEAPMKLEAIAEENIDSAYSFEMNDGMVSFSPAIRGIVEDLSNDEDEGVISARFHNTVANAVWQVCEEIRSAEKHNKVALSGGSFQNRYLTRRVIKLLKDNGFDVYLNQSVPPNDGGISLGQLAIAAKKMK